jgi:hypothetical protein
MIWNARELRASVLMLTLMTVMTVRESRRLDHGPQHVRTGARTLAGL